jgi:hypothetical protein
MRQQIRVSPFLDDLPAIDHHHPVRALHRAQPVSDDQRRTPL